MRELKFRHWSEEAGMSQPFTFEDCDFISGLPLHDEPSVIMQFTGIHDKNGVEIYEGDILSNSFMDSSPKKKSYVIWRDGTWRLVVGAGATRPLYNNMGWCSIFEPRYGGVEVIGNIYENPELLGIDERECGPKNGWLRYWPKEEAKR